MPRVGLLALRLEEAGIDPASVTDVVLTHMHMDHCGGLLADGVKEQMRPDLRVHVAAAEADFWESPDFSRVSMPPGFPDALRRTGKRFLKEYHSQMRTFFRPKWGLPNRFAFCRYVPSISTNYLIGRSTSHQACGSFESC
jgi:glyoxylase-like metal-dependent hydrolase (beta-lactamase superfamily II)